MFIPVVRGAKTGGMGGYIPPNNLAASPQLFDYGLHLSAAWSLDIFWPSLDFGEKSSSILGEDLSFLIFTWFAYVKK